VRAAEPGPPSAAYGIVLLAASLAYFALQGAIIHAQAMPQRWRSRQMILADPAQPISFAAQSV
jgi:hypothetical protein